MKTALYRHFDAAGQLLYVGVSLCAFQRTRQHGQSAPWFEDVTRIDIEWFASRSLAEAAEWRAIRNEKPLHNQTFNRKTPAPGDAIIVLDGQRRAIPNPVLKPIRKLSYRRELARQRAENVAKRSKSA